MEVGGLKEGGELSALRAEKGEQGARLLEPRRHSAPWAVASVLPGGRRVLSAGWVLGTAHQPLWGCYLLPRPPPTTFPSPFAGRLRVYLLSAFTEGFLSQPASHSSQPARLPPPHALSSFPVFCLFKNQNLQPLRVPDPAGRPGSFWLQLSVEGSRARAACSTGLLTGTP